jgi:hypothetical protein
MRKIRGAGLGRAVRHPPVAGQEAAVSRVISMVSLVVLVGCGRAPEQEELKPVFTADAVGEGAALLTRATVTGTDVDVSIVGRSLGPILGYAFTLRFDGLTPQGDAAAEEALGPSTAGEAVYLAKLRDGALVIGGARQGSAAGERAVDQETVLTKLRFTLTGAAASLKLGATSVRRANGDGVVHAAGGGKIGGAP